MIFCDSGNIDKILNNSLLQNYKALTHLCRENTRYEGVVIYTNHECTLKYEKLDISQFSLENTLTNITIYLFISMKTHFTV